MTTQTTPTANTPNKAPETNAPSTSASVAKPKHRHTNSDQQYQNTCKACRAEDAERSRAGYCNIPEEDLVRTTFLIPDTQYDGAVCRAYLAEKYPDAIYIGASLDLGKLAGFAEGEQIVVVRRDTWPKTPGVNITRAKDVEGKWEYTDVAPEAYISEVVESAPIDVRKTISISKADRFTKSELDIRPLLQRLSEQMPPPYRIDLPRHKNDSVLYFVYA